VDCVARAERPTVRGAGRRRTRVAMPGTGPRSASRARGGLGGARGGPKGRSEPCGGNGREGSAQGGEVQIRGLSQGCTLLPAERSGSGLDEVAEDSADLLGIGDHGHHPHLRATASAAKGIDLVDLRDQSGPCGPLRGPWAWMVAARPSWPGGAGLLLGDGQVRLLLGGLAEVGRGLQGVLLLPARRRPAPRGRGGPGRACATTSHGNGRSTSRSDGSGGPLHREGVAGGRRETRSRGTASGLS